MDKDEALITETKEPFWHHRHFRSGFLFFRVYIRIFVMYLAILSIYWGSWYQRSSRLVNLKVLVVTDDRVNGPVGPLLDMSMRETMDQAAVKLLAGWVFKPASEIETQAERSNRTVMEEITRLVHHQEYWAAVWIHPNATFDLYNALMTRNQTFTAAYSLIDCVYETGRDLLATSTYLLPSLHAMERAFLATLSQTVYLPLLSLMPLEAKEQLAANTTLASTLLLPKPFFQYVDIRPVPQSAALGPGELGLVYTLVLSFHQYNFALRISDAIRPKLRRVDFIYYRFMASQSAFFFIALVYCLMTVAFQVPTGRTFGKAGFLVYWGIMYLNLSALGGINECVVQLVMAYDRALTGFWIVFHVVISISTAFSPIALSPQFYRYGYAMPVYNTCELLKVVLFDTYKGRMWRPIVINFAWVLLSNALLPFSLRWAIVIAALQAKKAEKQKQAMALWDKPKAAAADTEKSAPS